MSTSELTIRNEGKLILFEATFKVKTSRLVEASGNTLSATLMLGLQFELLTSKNVTDQPQNLMIQAGFENLNHLLLIVATDQLQNLMMNSGFQNLDHLLLMATQTGLDFHALVYIC